MRHLHPKLPTQSAYVSVPSVSAPARRHTAAQCCPLLFSLEAPRTSTTGTLPAPREPSSLRLRRHRGPPESQTRTTCHAPGRPHCPRNVPQVPTPHLCTSSSRQPTAPSRRPASTAAVDQMREPTRTRRDRARDSTIRPSSARDREPPRVRPRAGCPPAPDASPLASPPTLAPRADPRPRLRSWSRGPAARCHLPPLMLTWRGNALLSSCPGAGRAMRRRRRRAAARPSARPPSAG